MKDLDGEENEDWKVQSNTVLRLLKLMMKYRSPFFLGLVMVILGTSATLLEPRIFEYAIDEAIVPKRWDRLQWVSLIFMGVTLLRTFAARHQGYFFEQLGQKVTQELRNMLFNHLQRMPHSTYDQYPVGRLLTRVTNDVAALNEMFSAGFVSMICNILLVFGILTGLMILDFKLGMIASSVFPFMMLIGMYFSEKLKIAYREARSKLSAVNAFLAENFSGMKTIHLFNRQGLHLRNFEHLNDRYAEAQTASIRIYAFFQPLITIASGISLALIIGFGGRDALSGRIKLGVLVAFFSYALSLFQPIREIADKWNVFLSGIASAERIFSVLNWKTELEAAEVLVPARAISDLKGHIVFENVGFAYEAENWILKDLSFEIQPGEKIGIVGHTGAGKSSVIGLLLRFYEPQRGRILLDGKDLRAYDKRALRASIGLVQQDVFLFSGSFRDNVTFWEGADTHKMEMILNALEFTSKKDLLFEERGGNFSMGERQVISFARAMAIEPRVWILDEATANMDSEKEKLLQTTLEKVTENRTALVIAHRLATVRTMDRVLVLHKGRLMEAGGHDALMSLNGLYSKLYQYQAMSETTSKL